jgi:hypothetical protein
MYICTIIHGFSCLVNKPGENEQEDVFWLKETLQGREQATCNTKYKSEDAIT